MNWAVHEVFYPGITDVNNVKFLLQCYYLCLQGNLIEGGAGWTVCVVICLYFL